MKNFNKILLGCAALVAAFSCAPKASVKVSLSDAKEGEVVVKLLNVNHFEVLDTVKISSTGLAECKVEVAKDDPEFVYIYYKDTKIASLILCAGDKVKVSADTLGNFSVEGSAESVALAQVEDAYAEFLNSMQEQMNELELLKEGSAEYVELTHSMAQAYVAYYRECVRYVLSNPYSLTNVPIFYQTMGGGVPVFNQGTDAVLFGNACDSLETVYPASRYVKALRSESARRYSAMELNAKIAQAQMVNYLDIEMPDVQGVKRKLSECEGKVVLVHFWSSSEAAQKMFNLEVLKGIYADFHGKGLEIYQVAIDTDKASWARIVKEQGLEWVNVCDGLGTSSPVISSYQLTQTPTTFLIANDTISTEAFSNESELRSVLRKLLK